MALESKGLLESLGEITGKFYSRIMGVIEGGTLGAVVGAVPGIVANSVDVATGGALTLGVLGAIGGWQFGKKIARRIYGQS